MNVNDPAKSPVPDHIRAAIHAGHIGQVTIFCDNCGVEDTADYTADYTGETRDDRFAAARRHLAETKGWDITPTYDHCPDCRAVSADPTTPPPQEGRS